MTANELLHNTIISLSEATKTEKAFNRFAYAKVKEIYASELRSGKFTSLELVLNTQQTDQHIWVDVINQSLKVVCGNDYCELPAFTFDEVIDWSLLVEYYVWLKS